MISLRFLNSLCHISIRSFYTIFYYNLDMNLGQTWVLHLEG